MVQGVVLSLGIVLSFSFFLFSAGGARAEAPVPKIWPTRLKALLVQSLDGQLGILDLWYDWGKGMNLHIIREQLSPPIYDVEWTNGTIFHYEVEAKSCTTITLDVGILRPNWMEGGNYLGVREKDGFTCNVWEKASFILYFEEVETKLPVYWEFLTTGRQVHVITFEEGVALQEEIWQAPAYCFTDKQTVLSDTPSTYGNGKLPAFAEYKELLLSGSMNA